MSAHDFEVFFDGECPLCKKEIDFVRRLDTRGGLLFTDIASKDFDPASVGKTYEELMARIHGRTPEGALVEGVEVFRRMYAAAGLGPLVALTRLPGVSQLLDLGYHWFADNRLRLTGRCEGGTCAIPRT